MRLGPGPLHLEVTSDLVEEVLQLASKHAEPVLRRQFLDEREDIAGIEIVDIREERFRDLDARWAERFRVTEVLRELLASLPAKIGECVIGRARLAKEERAVLEGPRARATLRMLLRAESLLSRERLSTLLADLETPDQRSRSR